MRNVKKIYLIFIIIATVFALSGCGKKVADMQTVLTVDKEGSGVRQIIMSVNSSELEKIYSGGIDKLRDDISKDIPSDFEWTVNNEGQIYKFLFKLNFSSISDYISKAEKLTGRKVSIKFKCPDTVFSKGLFYEENFTSTEIMSWMGTFLKNNGVDYGNNIAELFNNGGVQMVFGDEIYDIKSETIKVESLIDTPVEEIDILTQYFQNKECSRQVKFFFSDSSMSENGEKIKMYMKTTVPKTASGEWTAQGNKQVFTVSAENINVSDLNDLMKRIFRDSESFVTAQTPTVAQKDKSVFRSAIDWSEYIDAGYFVSDEDSKIKLGYYIKSDDGCEINVHKQNSEKSYKLTESEKYGGYQTVIEDKIKDISLVTEISTVYIVDEINVETGFKKNDILYRNTELKFASIIDDDDRDEIRAKIAENADGYADVSMEKNKNSISIFVKQEGDEKTLNTGFKKIFGVQGQIHHEEDGKMFDFHHESSFSDLTDYTKLIANDPFLTTLNYTLKLPLGERIKEETLSTSLNSKASEEIKSNEYKCSTQGAYLSITFMGSVINKDGFTAILLILVFIGIIIAILFFNKNYKKVFDKFKKINVHGLFNKDIDKTDKKVRRKRTKKAEKDIPEVEFSERVYEEESEEENYGEENYDEENYDEEDK